MTKPKPFLMIIAIFFLIQINICTLAAGEKYITFFLLGDIRKREFFEVKKKIKEFADKYSIRGKVRVNAHGTIEGEATAPESMIKKFQKWLDDKNNPAMTV